MVNSKAKGSKIYETTTVRIKRKKPRPTRMMTFFVLLLLSIQVLMNHNWKRHTTKLLAWIHCWFVLLIELKNNCLDSEDWRSNRFNRFVEKRKYTKKQILIHICARMDFMSVIVACRFESPHFFFIFSRFCYLNSQSENEFRSLNFFDVTPEGLVETIFYSQLVLSDYFLKSWICLILDRSKSSENPTIVRKNLGVIFRIDNFISKSTIWQQKNEHINKQRKTKKIFGYQTISCKITVVDDKYSWYKQFISVSMADEKVKHEALKRQEIET